MKNLVPSIRTTSLSHCNTPLFTALILSYARASTTGYIHRISLSDFCLAITSALCLASAKIIRQKLSNIGHVVNLLICYERCCCGHLRSPQIFKPIECPDNRAGYCLGFSFLPLRTPGIDFHSLVEWGTPSSEVCWQVVVRSQPYRHSQ